MKKLYGCAAAAALLVLLAAGQEALAASPGRVSYQGTLRKDGRLFSGTASMEFKLVSQDGLTEYWNSGSTDVVVSSGLFRYPLGTPNEVQFAAISWKDISPYVQMRVDGLWLPSEPLYSSVYSQHALTAESSTGTFTVSGGDLRITGAVGGKGIIFPNGTAQYYAPGWEAPTAAASYFGGSAGLGLVSPQTRLDVQGAAADTYVQFWRDSGGVIRASMTAAGVLYADASGIRNLPAGADNLGSHVAASALQMSGFPILNASSGTFTGTLTAYSSVTVAGQLGLSAARLQFGPAYVSSASAANHGGVYVSSNVYLPAGAKYYGDGSALTGVSGTDTLGTHVATRTLDMAGFPITNISGAAVDGNLTAYSSVTVTGELGLAAGRVALSPGVEMSSAAAGNYGGVFFSSHVYLPAGAKFYGDGTGLTGLTGIADNLGTHIATRTLEMSDFPIVNASSLTLNGVLTSYSSATITGAPGLGSPRVEFRPGAFISSAAASNYGGVLVSSHVYLPAGARYYGDGSGLTFTADMPTRASSQTFTGSNVFASSTTFTLISPALPGVSISSGLIVAAGNAGFGTAAPLERVDVSGGVRIGNSGNANAGTLRYTGAAFEGYTGGSWVTLNGSYSVDTSTALWGINNLVTPNTVYTVGQSSNVAIGTMNAGVSKLRVTGAGNTSATNALLAENLGAAQIFLVRNDGLVSVGPQTPSTRLDVQAAVADTYSQIWRDSGGAVVSSMSAGGILYASAAGLRGLPGDSLGSHVATMTVQMSGYPIVNAGSITVSGVFTSYSSATVAGALGVGSPRLELRQGVALSSGAAAFYGGVYISSHVYLPAGAKYYGDGSGLTGVAASADSLGSHIATMTVQMSGYPIVNAGSITVSGVFTSYSSATVGGALGVGAARLRLASGVEISSAPAAFYGGVYVSTNVYLPAGGKYYGDGSALTGIVSADTLGTHVATTTLQMAGFPIVNAGSFTVTGALTSYSSATVAGALGMGAARLELAPGVAVSSAAAANYGGVLVTTHVYLAGGRLYGDGGGLSGLNASSLASGEVPDARLSANVALLDSAQSFSGLIGFTVEDAFLPGVYISSGLTVADGKLLVADRAGIGTLSPQEKLDVNGAIRVGDTATSNAGAIKFAGGGFQGYNGTSWVTLNGSYSVDTSTALWGINEASTPNTVYLVGLSSSIAIGKTDAGSSKLRVTGAGNTSAASALLAESQDSTQILLARNDGAVAVGPHSPAARLDVQPGASDIYVQVWRDSTGVEIASMTQTGSFFADATQLRNLPQANVVDTLAATLAAGRDAGGSYINNLSSAAIGLAAGEAALDVQSAFGEQYAQIWRDFTGVAVASVSAGGVLYADASQLRNLPQGNVVDTLAATLAAGRDAGGSYINNLSSAAIGLAAGEAALDVQSAFGEQYAQIWRDFTGVAVASVSAGGVLYADASQLRNLPQGNVVDTLAATLAAGRDAGGSYINNLSSAAIGRADAEAPLDVQPAFLQEYDQVWRDWAGVVQASMTGTGILYADGSGLRNIAGDGLGAHTAAADLNMAGFKLINASTVTAMPGEPGIAFSTSLYVGGNVLATGGAVFGEGPVLVGTQLPLAAVHVSSVAGYAGDLILVSTGGATVMRVTGAGGVYASKFYGDGSNLSGVTGGGLTNPMVTDLDLGGNRIFNIAEIDEVAVSSRLAVGHDAGPSSPVVAMIMETFADADISADFPNEGMGTLVLVEPVSDRTGAEMVIGGDFIAGTVQAPGNMNKFPAILGLRATALAQTGGTISAAYGLYTQNQHSAGVVTNNFGVFIDVPNSTATITNNTGLYVKDQHTYGAPFGHNIVSAGADSMNYFEGTIQAREVVMMGGGLALTGMNKAALGAMTPFGPGMLYFCADCSSTKVVVSTGAAVGSFSGMAGENIN